MLIVKLILNSFDYLIKLKGTFRINDSSYLKATEACQTNAKSKKRTGIIGSTSTMGSKGAYASGKRPNTKPVC